jgi:hypothetical protein
MPIRSRLAAAIIGTMLLLPLAAAAESLSDIRQQQEKIRDDLANGALKLDADRRRIVEQEQRVVFDLADASETLDALNPRQRIGLRNALQKIDAALSLADGAEEDREVCWQERRTGSKLTTTVCGTVRERQQAKEGARDYLQRPRICAPPGCGASP